jgi:preprotein translocase subunit Sec61beta
MEILTSLIDKALFVAFFMSCLIIIRQLFLFVRHLNKPEPQSFEINPKNLTYLAISVAIILTTIFKGIGL